MKRLVGKRLMFLLKQIGEREALDIRVRNRFLKHQASLVLVFLFFFLGFHQSGFTQKLQVANQIEETFEMKFDMAFSEGLRYKMLGNDTEALTYFTQCTKLIEGRAAPYFELGSIALKKKDLASAELNASTAFSIEPENKWYTLLYIQVLVSSERYAEAAQLYAALYEQNNDTPEFLRAEADLLMKSGDYKNGLKRLAVLSKIEGFEAEAGLREKDVYLLMGKDKKAISALRDLADRFPDQIEYRGILAELLVEKGFDNEAIKEYQKIKDSNPENPIVYYSLGQFYMVAGQRDEAIKEFETGFRSKQVNPEIKVSVFMELMKDQGNKELDENLKHLLDVLYETDQGHPGIDAMYADYLYGQEEFDESEVIYRRVVLNNPGNFMAWQNLLFIQNQQLDFEEMFSVADKSVKAFPSQTLFFLFKGISANALEKYEIAVEALKKGARLNGGNSDITKQYYISLGDALYHTGNYDEAFRNLDLLLVLDSGNAMVLNNYAYYLSVLDRDLEKALTMIQKCLDIEPDNTTYLDTKAWVLYKLKRYTEALEVISIVVQEDGDSASGEVIEHYGDILFRNNKTDEALEAWIKARGMEGASENIGAKIERKGIYE